MALIFAVVSGEHFSSYYLFWSSLAFAIFYIAATRGAYERSPPSCCAPPATSAEP